MNEGLSHAKVDVSRQCRAIGLVRNPDLQSIRALGKCPQRNRLTGNELVAGGDIEYRHRLRVEVLRRRLAEVGLASGTLLVEAVLNTDVGFALGSQALVV